MKLLISCSETTGQLRAGLHEDKLLLLLNTIYIIIKDED